MAGARGLAKDCYAARIPAMCRSVLSHPGDPVANILNHRPVKYAEVPAGSS